jgi:hypothetical protein
MKKLQVLRTVTVAGKVNVSLEDTIKEAIKLSKKLDCEIMIMYCGIPLRVSEGSIIDNIMDYYQYASVHYKLLYDRYEVLDK